ncbi:MAG: U32 family peptidase [Turicibacter sp.]|nr:U32 family peptidase [Turicibacter sp.]
MSRLFCGKEVELLAPAGNFQILKDLLGANCDAFYFGGKKLNMRLHRKDFNFENDELIEAVKMAHDVGKKVHITVNNLHSVEELDEIDKYLLFLAEQVQPDAVIMQDLGVVEKAVKLGLNVHASVMMNVHNTETIRELSKLGVTRVIMSRESTLDYARLASKTTDMELEYFVHGDMCIASSGQCQYSGLLFGKSGSRGECLKPCRWRLDLEANGKLTELEFPLSARDMSMYEHIPELIDCGITSFKIEGRMRDSEYLTTLINLYGDAIDRYIADPLAYDRKIGSATLFENRKRDLTTAYAFGTSGLDYINSRFEGTGKFYSSGKPFSLATEERGITDERLTKIKTYLADFKADSAPAKIGVKVNDYNSALAALKADADYIYLSGHTFLPSKPFSKSEILDLTQNKKNAKIYLGTPHMMFDNDFREYEHLLSQPLGLDGVLATSLGAVSFFAKFGVIGDYQLNVYNRKAADFYTRQGIRQFTILPEAKLSDTADILSNFSDTAALVVQGTPTIMYLEHNLHENLDGGSADLVFLVDEKGFKHPIRKDRRNKNYMLLYKEISLLPVLKELRKAGLVNLTIEAAHMSPQEVTDIIGVYKQALANLDTCASLYTKISATKEFSFGGLEF